MDQVRLRRWYLQHSRDLPWRVADTTPWAILVSEVMLQQTPVARVTPAWREWMNRWPEPHDLANATLADVVRQWDRLGYPRRAKNLHACAKVLVAHHQGQVPHDLPSLLALPGVGHYTARAVMCFAFGIPAPVVDTNVKRVVARAVDGVAGAGQWNDAIGLEKVHRIVEADASAADYCLSQKALMELGALVCSARTPRCGNCPVASSCLWRMLGYPVDTASLPRRQARYEGSDRQARGVMLRAVREARGAIDRTALLSRWQPRSQGVRALDSLVQEGFVEEVDTSAGLSYRLSGEPDPVE